MSTPRPNTATANTVYARRRAAVARALRAAGGGATSGYAGPTSNPGPTSNASRHGMRSTCSRCCHADSGGTVTASATR